MIIDPVALRAAEPAVTGLAATVGEILRELGASLDAEGECWGRDRIGAAFARAYLASAAPAREAMPLLDDTVRAVGQALLLAADGAEAADARGRTRLGTTGGRR